MAKTTTKKKRKAKKDGLKQHKFRNKLILNQWLISLFGIDPLAENTINRVKVRPFTFLSKSIRDTRFEGLEKDNLHIFYHELVGDYDLFNKEFNGLTKPQILRYEENIARHTSALNERRQRPVVWKYFQWLTLLFTEIYLDRFFEDKESLLRDLNDYVKRFNDKWTDYTDIPFYAEDDLNKICLQNATGSGKTLLMHINLMQFSHYAKKHGKDNELSRAILLTPNERLSQQHIWEFEESNFSAKRFSTSEYNNPTFDYGKGLRNVSVLEITKLADHAGPNTLETRSLGDQNLLLVDEGHRGLSGKDAKKNENAWFKNRAMLCERGFTFEYSATFEQAVSGTGHEDDYAKAVLFDYSYRWFYEDGFGKDYQILNLPKSYNEVQAVYLTACLLKFYQQLCIYEDKKTELDIFNVEKPLWVFVGSTVVKKSGSKETEEPGKEMLSDIGLIIQFVADFLNNRETACKRINEILTGKGQDTGLLDSDGNDIFQGSFDYLIKNLKAVKTDENIYKDILSRLFNGSSGGNLILNRIKGESGEIALRIGSSETPFGLINVGDSKGLCDHMNEVASNNGILLSIEDSDFTEAMFDSVKDSTSPINMLIGSKKFVEGWDCWRVSTMGLMHVGRTEGSQIIQLFGRGVRLKGFEWSLKRSGYSHAPIHPAFIEEIETLNVFGIEADFMEKFREYLKDEGLPGNEKRRIFTIPLNITYDFGKKLKILRPKKKSSDGQEYDFKKDGPVPMFGDIPEYLCKNAVLVDWYPRIQALQSRSTSYEGQKDRVSLRESHLALLNYDSLYFEMEQFKREKYMYNLNISKENIRELLHDNTWYTLYLPETRLEPRGFDGLLLLQQVTLELLKGYCQRFYDYRKRQFIEPRLELRELTSGDDNLPKEDFYQLIVDGDEAQVIQAIEKLKKEIESGKHSSLNKADLKVCYFGKHLFEPLLHVRQGAKISVMPVTLNISEYQFVIDLKTWCDKNKSVLEEKGVELFLLRNQSRGKGIGFFEAGGFHPDFILWILAGDKQYVTFIEPHGLIHEGPGSEKILFYERIKDIEKRLNDPAVILNSFILSWTKHPHLDWNLTKDELEKKHVLFMTEDPDHYIEKLFDKIYTPRVLK